MKSFFIVFLMIFHFPSFAQTEKIISKIYEFDISSTINPAVHRYLQHGFKKIQDPNSSAILIKINTPGGLVSTTKDILNLFGEYKIPIIIWITPEGSSATSAGALISSGAHFLFMSESTNIGAATPISSTGKNIDGQAQDSDLRSKAVNDLVALTKSYGESRGRNYKPYELMISQAKSYSATEAKKLKAIDEIINSKDDLENFITGKKIKINGQETIVTINNPEYIEVKMKYIDYLLNIFAHPQFAYIFFMIGAALLYFELQAPGGMIAGAIGVVCLLIAGMGFSVLPINIGAIALIGASIILFILEIYITSFGILSIAGVLSLLFGSLLLFDTPDSLISLDKTTIYSTVFGVSAVIVFFSYEFLKSRNQKQEDFFVPKDQIGTVCKIIDDHNFQIKIDGQIWKATSIESLNIDDKVSVIGNKNLILKIKKYKESL